MWWKRPHASNGRRQGLRHHRPSRVDDSAAGRRADREASMIPEPPLELEPHPEPPPERYPFWGYGDVLVFAGLAIPCMLLGWGIGESCVLDSCACIPSVETWELLLDAIRRLRPAVRRSVRHLPPAIRPPVLGIAGMDQPRACRLCEIVLAGFACGDRGVRARPPRSRFRTPVTRCWTCSRTAPRSS